MLAQIIYLQLYCGSCSTLYPAPASFVAEQLNMDTSISFATAWMLKTMTSRKYERGHISTLQIKYALYSNDTIASNYRPTDPALQHTEMILKAYKTNTFACFTSPPTLRATSHQETET